MKVLIVAIFFALSFAVVCSADDDTREGGLFSKGSFLSEAIGSTADKLNKVTSGEEKIIDNDAKGIPQDALEYNGDPFGRPLPKPSFRNNKRENTL